jgi:hypothetical protein
MDIKNKVPNFLAFLVTSADKLFDFNSDHGYVVDFAGCIRRN